MVDPADIVTVGPPVDPNQEAMALIRNVEARPQYPVFWFENVRGWPHPVVTNVHASPPRLA